MKKVGIITYHFARNYGAVIQCYALQEALKKENFDVKVINFVSEEQRKNNSLFNKREGVKNIIMNLLLLPFKKKRIKKEERFETFVNNKLNCTRLVKSHKELKELIEEEKFDFLVSGSDQVLNPHIKDFDEAFLLPFDCECKKVMYAASTGSATNKELLKYNNYIDSFNSISLREEKGKKALDGVTEKKIEVVADPTLLLNKEEWLQNRTHDDSNYVACYLINKNNYEQGFKIAQKVAKDNNLKLKIINARFSKNSFKKGTVIDAGPEEFLNIIKNAELVCTDSFHGTVFSIIYGKKFICIDRKDNINDSRKLNLLEHCGLQNRILLLPCELNEVKLLKDEYDVDEKLGQLRETSIDFIRRSIC